MKHKARKQKMAKTDADQAVVMSEKGRLFRFNVPKGRALIALVVVGVLLISSATGWFIWSVNRVEALCNDEVMTRVDKQLNSLSSDNPAKIAAIAKELKDKNSEAYNAEPDCMYIEAQNQVLNGNSKAAQEKVEQLKQIESDDSANKQPTSYDQDAIAEIETQVYVAQQSPEASASVVQQGGEGSVWISDGGGDF